MRSTSGPLVCSNRMSPSKDVFSDYLLDTSSSVFQLFSFSFCGNVPPVVLADHMTCSVVFLRNVLSNANDIPGRTVREPQTFQPHNLLFYFSPSFSFFSLLELSELFGGLSGGWVSLMILRSGSLPRESTLPAP